MAIELQDLLKEVSHMKIEPVAGEKGLRNSVFWVHIIEGPEAVPYLGRGELAITTGAAMRENVEGELLAIVQEICERQAAGLLVNIGPFIHSIPQAVLDFCNDRDFPLFVFPWEIYISELMQIFCFALTLDRQRSTETASAFQNAILFPENSELYTVALNRAEFRKDWNYGVSVIRTADPYDEKSLSLLCFRLDNYLQHNYRNTIAFLMEDELVVIAANIRADRFRIFIESVRSFFSSYYASLCYYIGAGQIVPSVSRLGRSYTEAKTIVDLHGKDKIREDLIFYSDMGIYRLLMCIEDEEALREYFEQTIRPLMDYDEKNHLNLTQVVDSYLTHSGSVNEVAKELYLHRNTINYRIKRAEEILSMNLSLHETRFKLRMGFLIRDMLGE